MSFSPTSRQVILQEVFDEASVPTDEEIYEYALRIGIDVENEPHLLHLAKDGLMQALPPGWKPCFDKSRKEIYYFNFKTKKTQWEHPLDNVYRTLVKKARTESATTSDLIDDDSRTSIKEDLKSFEEASFILPSNEMYPKVKKLDSISSLGKGVLKRTPPVFNPKKSNSKDLLKTLTNVKSHLHIDEDKLMQKSDNEDPQMKLYNETEVRKRPNSSDIRNRRNISPMEFRNLSKQEIIMPSTLDKLNLLSENKRVVESKISESPSVENKGSDYGLITRDEGYGTEFSVSSLGEKEIGGKKELTLTGGGSVFLKSNKIKSSPSSDLVTSSFSKEELSDGLLSPDVRKSGSELDSQPKGILRDQNVQKSNEKISNVVDKKIKNDIEDDRKSVRFNLEKELKITFEIPPANSSESDENTSGRRSMISKPKLEPPKVMEETRLIEVDFDDLNIDISEEKPVKVDEEKDKIVQKLEPKKFKPSQTLVKEFREMFENPGKSKITIVGSSKAEENQEIKSSQSSSSRSLPSQDDKLSSQEDSKFSQMDNLIDLRENKESQKSSGELTTDVFDSTLNNLVDFALKKTLDIDSKKESNRSIFNREKDSIFELLKGVESESIESEEEKVFADDDKELEYLDKLESQINEKTLKRKELEKNYGKLRNEKENEMKNNHKIWLEELEESYEQKKKEELMSCKKKYESWLEEKQVEFEKLHENESKTRFEEFKKKFINKEEEEMEKLKSRLELEQKERLKKLKQEIGEREKKELETVRKAFEENLNEKKIELMKKHKEEIEKIERNLEDVLSEQKSQKLKELELAKENEAVIEVMRLEMKESYQKQKNSLMKEHDALLENLRQEHALAVEKLKIEFKNEEEALKKSHLNRLDEIRMRIEVTEGKKYENLETPRTEATEARVFEKVRCEKRLLEDKYKTLKEKYIRLKTEAKSTLERKKKTIDETTTGSEAERSSSQKTKGMIKSDNESPNTKRKQEADKKFKLKKHINNLDYLYHSVSTEDEENLMSPKNLPHYHQNIKNEEKQVKENEKIKEELSGEEKKEETKKKRQLFLRFKAASTSKINGNNKNQGKEFVLSPVENLRRQLKKLEELEDQFPVTTHTDTYMRYPFTDSPQFGSSEIEFFKHRIHLERESVRRAKDSLKAQKKSFENRQKELKQKLIEGEPGTKNVIDQVYQEEKELTDMEVSVHRTRALLGEKIIRLRHLEQSLKRISQPIKKDSFSVKSKDLLGRLGVRNQSKEEDRTLSDLSSYSGSSGFSSTDFNETHNIGGRRSSILEQNRRHFQNNMQESSEIIQSLENLNSEIREIWEVLKKQHQSGQETITMLPPPPLIYGDLGWPAFTLSPPLPFRNTVITSTSNFQRPMAQQFKTQVTTGTSNQGHMSTVIDSTLVDRTRSLRDWLKAARNSSTLSDVTPGQVTL